MAHRFTYRLGGRSLQERTHTVRIRRGDESSPGGTVYAFILGFGEPEYRNTLHPSLRGAKRRGNPHSLFRYGIEKSFGERIATASLRTGFAMTWGVFLVRFHIRFSRYALHPARTANGRPYKLVRHRRGEHCSSCSSVFVFIWDCGEFVLRFPAEPLKGFPSVTSPALQW